jgi:hypothetical protein
MLFVNHLNFEIPFNNYISNSTRTHNISPSIFLGLGARPPFGNVIPLRGRADAGAFSAHENPILLKML